eukprot:882339-Amphidinium_carterae.2
MDYYNQFSQLGIRDSPTHDKLEMLAKQVFASLRNRSREVATSRVAMKTTMTNKERTSALAAGADNRQETEQERKERYAKMVCKFFASDDGCKKGKSCEAKHVPKDKGCKVCGSIKHHTSKCDRTQPSKPKAEGKKPPRRDGKPGAHAADGKSPPKKDKDRKKDEKNSKDKPKKTSKKPPSGPRAREAALEQDGEAGDSDKEQTSPEQTYEEEVTDSEAELEEFSEASKEDSDTPSSTGAMAVLYSEEDSEVTPHAYATKTNKTPMFLDPVGKAYALVDSGATHVTLNLKHLPADKSEATLVEMTLASGKVDASLFLDEVFAKDVKTPLCPLRRITTKLDISIEWQKIPA